MKIVILGKTSQLSKSLKKYFLHEKFISSKNINFLHTNKIYSKLNSLKFNFLINCFSFTDVNDAEKNKRKCLKINSQSIYKLVKVCKKKNATLIHFSSDYVFSGNKNKPYNETDKTKPINYYGKTKLISENIIKKKLKKYYIFRLSHIYSIFKGNLVYKVINNIKKNKNVNLVTDHFCIPTSVDFVAHAIHKVVNAKKKYFGLYHLSPYGKNVSIYKFFLFLIKNSKLKKNFNEKKITKITLNKYNNLVKRPKYSIMNCKKFKKNFNYKISSWKSDVKNYINKYNI
jgi:dTDP-4-dehydrorhamnose reductase